MLILHTNVNPYVISNVMLCFHIDANSYVKFRM